MYRERVENKLMPLYKLIVTDINMPVMGGIETASQIRRIEAANSISPSIIVATTAGDIGNNPNFGRPQEFNECLQKPITKDSFGKMLRRHNLI